MKRFTRTFAMGLVSTLLALATSAFGQQAQSAQYASMAPLDQYLMERDAEIALAKTAAPESISREAEVLVLGRKGYETAEKGKNGFTCLVQRSWTAGIDEPEFWNPKVRAPICYNASASRSYLQRVFKETELALAGRSKEQICSLTATALEKKELPGPELGSMCYMLSKQGYLNDRAGHWHPHLMFFLPETETTEWGANAAGSPILGVTNTHEHLTVFLIPLGHWSDGTAAPPMHESDKNVGQP
ncbi:MAG TPA: hypothetical protein VFU86_08185 [Terriglobales bacterium]|nr:hypothetical protein [Terriglobales bacterium]